MREQSAEERDWLETYDRTKFYNPLVTVDVVIFSVREGALRVLVTLRPDHPEKGLWALPGGFPDPLLDEDIEAAARRKLAEKTGIETPYLEQLKTVGNRDRDVRGWSVTVVYFALIDSQQARLTREPKAEWWSVEDPRLAELAFDHTTIFNDALDRLRTKVSYSTLPVHLMPEEFTLTELQDMYRLLLEHDVEKSAFRRRIKDSDIIEPIPDKFRLGANRPAQLYRIKPDKEPHLYERNLMGPRSK